LIFCKISLIGPRALAPSIFRTTRRRSLKVSIIVSKKAIIAGGSLGGLMTGIVLKALDLDVHIYERSPRVLDDRGAGIVLQAETEIFLTQYAGLRSEQTGVMLKYRQYLNRDGIAESHQKMPQRMTSWGLIYRALRSTFPSANYHQGVALDAFSQTVDGVIAEFDGADEVNADLLIGADGSRSFVRQRLMPEVKARYAGYVAWRGVVSESSATTLLRKTFVDHFTFQQMDRSHILCYLIPGAEGENELGKRRINWVWYWNVPEADLPELMTGVDGRKRDFSVPAGQVRDEWLKKQGAIAENVFCPQFLGLWHATVTPFLDLAVPRMVHGRALLLGDAAFIPRPHTGASTAKAGANALALGRALEEFPDDIDAALKRWEPDQLALGRELERSGKALGNRSQLR
jgi:2-polyprenyl-6-methoxyphenol hydroxylase-like FAD-dependent oxidoreductase